MFLDPRHTVFTFGSWLNLLGIELAFFQISSRLLTQGYIYHKLRKTFEKFFRSHSVLLSKFSEISFKNMFLNGSFTQYSTVIESSN